MGGEKQQKNSSVCTKKVIENTVEKLGYGWGEAAKNSSVCGKKGDRENR